MGGAAWRDGERAREALPLRPAPRAAPRPAGAGASAPRGGPLGQRGGAHLRRPPRHRPPLPRGKRAHGGPSVRSYARFDLAAGARGGPYRRNAARRDDDEARRRQDRRPTTRAASAPLARRRSSRHRRRSSRGPAPMGAQPRPQPSPLDATTQRRPSHGAWRSMSASRDGSARLEPTSASAIAHIRTTARPSRPRPAAWPWRLGREPPDHRRRSRRVPPSPEVGRTTARAPAGSPHGSARALAGIRRARAPCRSARPPAAAAR